VYSVRFVELKDGYVGVELSFHIDVTQKGSGDTTAKVASSAIGKYFESMCF